MKLSTTLAYYEDRNQQRSLRKKQQENVWHQKQEETLKKAQGKPKPSSSEYRKRKSAEIDPEEGNDSKNPKSEPKKMEISERPEVKVESRRP